MVVSAPPKPSRMALLLATVLDNSWIPHDPNIAGGRSPQTEFLTTGELEVLYGGSAGGGKAQPLDSLVLTPWGFKRMGDLEVGGLVCSPDGSCSKVLYIHPQGVKPTYRITMFDGSSCLASDEHLWLVHQSNDSRVINTLDLKNLVDEFNCINYDPCAPTLPVSDPSTSSTTQHRVVSVEYEGEIECQCISVSHPSGLYITDDFIVTHNSEALLMAAAQYVDVPGYNALLLRRTYQDLALPGALMSRSKEWWTGTAAHWNETGKVWTFPSGATITFGYLQHESDKYQYQSAAFSFVGLDELTQFTESQYTYLFSRLRRSFADSVVPLRMRSASNPGGRGHGWVKDRFITGSAPGRRFIPATLSDNPHLDSQTYIRSMMNLSPSDRKQLLDGVWEIDTLGRKFRRSWFKIVQDIPKGIRQVRCWDLAATPKIEDDPSSDPDYCTGIRGGISKAGIYYVTDVRRIRATPHRVEEFILRTAQLDGKQVRIYIEREPGASGKITESHFMRNVLNGFNMSGIPRVSKLRKEERADPVSSKAEQGLVCVLEAPWNHDFFDELEQFPDGDHDDMVDAFVDVVTKSEATPFKIWS